MKYNLALIALAVLLGAVSARSQDLAVVPPLSEILQKADSVSTFQDSLLAHTGYKVKENVVFCELDDKGQIKNADTMISAVTIENGKETARETIYSSRKSKSEDKKEKEKDESMGAFFKFGDPRYNFTLTGTTDSSYTVAFSPREKPQKGDLKGSIEIDRQNFYSRVLDIEVPKPEGALKEFRTWVNFEPMEGGLVVIREARTKGFVKALLGIVKMRFSGEIRYSDYQLLK